MLLPFGRPLTVQTSREYNKSSRPYARHQGKESPFELYIEGVYLSTRDTVSGSNSGLSASNAGMKVPDPPAIVQVSHHLVGPADPSVSSSRL